MIDLIFWFLASLASTFGIVYLFYCLSGATRKISWQIILFFLFGVIGITLFEYFDIWLLSSTFFFLFFPVLFNLIQPMNARKTFYYLFVVWAYGIIIDLVLILILTILSFMLGFTIYSNHNSTITEILSILIAITFLLISHSSKVKRITDYIYLKTVNIKYLNLSLVVFAVFTLITAILMLFNIGNLDVNLLLTLILVLLIIVLVLLVKFKIDKEENFKYLQTLKENNDFYIKMDDENRLFKHNLMAKLLSIKSVSNEKTMLLIEDMITSFNKNMDFSKHIKVIPYGLNGIIYQKLYSYLKELDIKVFNDIHYDIFDVLKPRRYNVFVEKIVIAIDNAIESCLNSLDKALLINIFEEDDALCVEIKNTFSNDLNIDELGNRNYSTKGKNHGLGLFSALRNNEATMEVKVINNLFIAKIIAKKY